MKLLALFPALLLAGLVYAAPTSEGGSDDKIVINNEFFPESLVVYTSEHDIVNILVPLNSLNFDDDEDDDDTSDHDDTSLIFFVEADINENGVQEDRGLYVLKNKESKKLLDYGRDAAASNDDTKTAYFAAKDGLYVYNAKENAAVKYGSVTDSLIGIAKVNGSDVIYVLNEEHQLYKVTEEGNKKIRIDDVQNAQQIILDYSNNLYYYDANKRVYVVTEYGMKQIEGLPETSSYIKLLKPPFVIDDGVPVIIDNKAYIAYANGSSEVTDFELEQRPTAYAMEATLIQYYAYNRKIYEYNLLAILFSEILSELKNYLDQMKYNIESIATRSRSDLRA